jgi:hypothetical protein
MRSPISGVAAVIVAGSLLLTGYSQYRSAMASSAEQRARAAEKAAWSASAGPPRAAVRGRGPTKATIEHEDRMGKREEAHAGAGDREVIRQAAAEPIRPGTVTRIGGVPGGGDSGRGPRGEDAW